MSRIAKKADNRRREIVTAARQLFQKCEYEKTSMQDIIDKLDIAKGTIYHYFTSKKELLEAVVLDIVEKDIGRKRDLLKNMRGNALQKFRALFGMDSMANKNDKILKQLHKPGNAGMHSRLLAVTIIKEASLYGEIIQQGCSEGIFKTNSPLECAEFMISGVQFLTDIGIYSWSQDDLQRRINAFPRLIEALLKAKPGSFNFLSNKI